MSKNNPRIIDIKQVGDKRKIVVLYDDDRYQFMYPESMSLAECKVDALAAVVVGNENVPVKIVETPKIAEPPTKKKWWRR